MKAHGVADNAALDALLVGERHAEEVAVNGDARSPAVLRRPALSEVIAFLREGGKAKRESGTDRTARAREVDATYRRAPALGLAVDGDNAEGATCGGKAVLVVDDDRVDNGGRAFTARRDKGKRWMMEVR